MMTILFSTFDPTTKILNLSLNLIITLMGIYMIPVMFWFIPSPLNIMWIHIILTLRKELKHF